MSVPQSLDSLPAALSTPPSPRRALPHIRVRLLSAAVLFAGAFASCDSGKGKTAAAGEPSAGEPSAGSAREAVDELIAAFQPVPLESTSDLQDKALHRQVAVVEKLRKAGPAVGRQALVSYRASTGAPDALRAALLEVASWNLPEETADLLARMVVEYDGQLGLGLRDRAVELLARTSPRRALEVLEPLARDPRQPGTLPPQATLVLGYAIAARAEGQDPTLLLADVATNIYQPSDARHAAVNELGSGGGRRSQLALEEVLSEPSSDGYLRRKAAQALQRLLPPETLCPLLQKAVENESDIGFLEFVRSMMDSACP